VKFLARQYCEGDGLRRRLVEGCVRIFGHANLAGLGQASVQMGRTGAGRCLSQEIATTRTTEVHVQCEQATGAPPGQSWWVVPVAQVSSGSATRAARSVEERVKTTRELT
jgi:TPP-dependent trihydroxycyclohexane-1,2-dione (THcHDO) dehydratase